MMSWWTKQAESSLPRPGCFHGGDCSAHGTSSMVKNSGMCRRVRIEMGFRFDLFQVMFGMGQQERFFFGQRRLGPLNFDQVLGSQSGQGSANAGRSFRMAGGRVVL